MKLKHIIFSLFILLFVSCQEDEMPEMGYLKLDVITNGNTITKASTTEQIGLKIFNSANQIAYQNDDYTTIKDNILLGVGTYRVYAYSSTKNVSDVSFDSPYYEGETTVAVEKNVIKPIQIECKISNVKVSVKYSDNLKKYFKSLDCIVTGAEKSLVFNISETRSGFYPVVDLNASLAMVNNDGKSFTLNTPITNVTARHHYKLNYDVSSTGGGDFDITFDPSLNQFNVTITVPVEPEVATDPNLSMTSVNAWGKFAYLYGSAAEAETENAYFQVRKSGSSQWTSILAQKSGNNYSVKTGELDFATSYEVRLMIGERISEYMTFKTESYEEIPNLNFDTWSVNGKNYFANSAASDSYWASGNTGITSILAGGNNANTVYVEDNVVRGKAARLTTLTGITLVGAAAGNLFIGSYATNMTNPSASVSFGRAYSGARPIKLSGYYDYKPAAISYGTKPGNLTTDECNIYIKLWDASGNEIAFGEFVGKETTSSYKKFDIDINYTNLTAKPAKITIVSTSSHYGGDFERSKVVGQVGSGSVLYVDEFTLSYF
ncbi:MAG: DUF4493 domain-containing protein [Bacteroidales bacterium]|nr:DUF4493 domain-containing protein [Bacteroidales bacterium]